LTEEKKNKLYFNLSHSAELLVYAVAFGKKIGVDIEINRPVTRMNELISRFFSEKEHSHLFSLPKNERNTESLWHWVAKEAYLKAKGEGISSIEVLRKRGELAICCRKNDSKCKNLQLNDFLPKIGYVGCVAYYE